MVFPGKGDRAGHFCAERRHRRGIRSELIDKVEDFFERAGKPEFQHLERVAIAISMFDLLLLRFGNRSRDIATEPEAVLAILHAHMRPAFDIIKDFGRSRRRSAISICVSSPRRVTAFIRNSAAPTLTQVPRSSIPAIRGFRCR
jgi:hypothetical protein